MHVEQACSTERHSYETQGDGNARDTWMKKKLTLDVSISIQKVNNKNCDAAAKNHVRSDWKRMYYFTWP